MRSTKYIIMKWEKSSVRNILYCPRVRNGQETFVVNTFFFSSFQLWSSYDHFPFRPAVYAYIIFYCVYIYIYINTYPAMFPRVTSYIYIYNIRSHTFDVGWRHFYFAFHSCSLTPHPLLPNRQRLYTKRRKWGRLSLVSAYTEMCTRRIIVFLYSSGSFCQQYI